jgi:hypothetical protein
MAKQNHREKSSNRPADEHHLIKLEKQAGCRDRPQPAWAKRKSQRRREFLALGLILGLAGCASVGVRNPTQGAANPRSPSQIFVAEFDAGKGIFQVNRSGDELVAFEQKTAGALADRLVADLSKSVVPASRQNDSSRPRGDAWLITGEFVRVSQGSRALRGLIDLGAGGTKMETIVRVYDLSGRSKEPVLQFETTGRRLLHKARRATITKRKKAEDPRGPVSGRVAP